MVPSMRLFLLFCALSCMTVQPIVGPYRTWMPWTPRWGARIFGTVMLATTITAIILKPKKRRGQEALKRARGLLYLLEEYNDPWAEQAYMFEYLVRRKFSKKITSWYWAMTAIAILTGLYTACEIFNRYYWAISYFSEFRYNKNCPCFEAGSKEQQEYLRAAQINHTSVSYFASRNGRNYVSSSVNSLPRLKGSIYSATDLAKEDVKRLLRLGAVFISKFS